MIRLTRRQLAALLIATPVLAQSPAPSTTSAVASAAPPTPEDPLQKALSDVSQTSAKLRAMQIPMNVEPAFRFEA